MKRVLSHLGIGTLRYTGAADRYCRFVLDHQLKDRTLWRQFVHVFSTREDALDDGWRGEYFGKMMRGACITYQYTSDQELYTILEQTVRDLLATQDDLGRIATYPPAHEYCGWDMWVRKYVLVGCLYFYDICKDIVLKGEILEAMKRHADAILSHIGEGKLSILDTSSWWGGINSSSILEPIVELYKKTGEARYLDFAKYIIAQGGCKGGDLLAVVEEGKRLPHEYPTTKAYEMMSFFEGVLAYYEVTGEERMLSIVRKFADKVCESEVTIVGSAGCKSEQFNHSVQKEAKKVPDKTIMQETCVTVTWMRLNERLLLDTGDMVYAERIESSALNALYGAVNLYGEEQFCKEEQSLLPGVPFDSYSPLICQPRGYGIGGYKKFAEGGYYGCCACIGAASTGLYPLISVLKSENGYLFTHYESGSVTFLEGGYSDAVYDDVKGELEMTFHGTKKGATYTFRIPSWANDPIATINGTEIPVSGDIMTLSDIGADGDVLKIEFHPELHSVKRHGRVAVKYGPYVLARDESKEPDDISKTIVLPRGDVMYVIEDAEPGETIHLRLQTKRGSIPLTDYASCGKHWNNPRNRISVWFKVRRSLFELIIH